MVIANQTKLAKRLKCLKKFPIVTLEHLISSDINNKDLKRNI